MTKYQLSEAQVAILNAARDVLHDAFSEWPATADDGKLYAIGHVAEDMLFDVLNWSQNHGGMALTDDQVHNRKAVAS